MGKKAIEQALREMEWEKAAQKSIAEACRHAYAMLDAQHIRYDKQLVAAKMKKDSMNWGVSEDIGKILWNIKDRVGFRPPDLDRFWRYVVTCMKFPPFEPMAQMRKRHAKRPLDVREWKLLMQIKRFPRTIKEYPPDWLDGALQSSPSFARVYELHIARAREIVGGQVDGDAFADTATRPFADTGKLLIEVDDKEFLEHLTRL